jgi:SAM-dependent methyltransferase
MAHQAQQAFCQRVRDRFPESFRRKWILDVGSLNINGDNRYLFEECVYVGIDVGNGPNVDIVSPLHKWAAPEDSFDTIISTECFEHDRHYPETLKAIVSLLKSGGLFLFTCASGDRKEHGTERTETGSSPLTCAIEGWENYYKNLFAKDVREVLDVEKIFSNHGFEETHEDLYFWGVKR